ncbi:MAG: 4Fe-4S binding protein [Candidatus Bathyarchaeota archaeon]|nr:4Fe-4S binding protein [Candidatus Bathyarchaeum tardum]WGM90424.1 MAG: 4Fe-4S binding protein [Candidatus Bathyarchaeum tardum]WNZ29507.1 MAG: 4Fe-4S binding protein [Candidatus Bathyarchaeota archaeon]
MVLRNIVQIDEKKCNGCGLCIPACAEGAIQIIDGKARLVKDMYCDGLGACLGKCPQDAITIIQREADQFDEEAAQEHVQATKKTSTTPDQPIGCPSAQPMQFDTQQPTKAVTAKQKSSLTTWPVQLKLLPPYAPFLKNADLLIAADCVPFAYANFHQDMLQNKVLTVGCPKLDDVSLYRNKLAEIFRTANIQSVTVVNMEVPCCFGLKRLVEEAMELSGKHVPLSQKTISIKGEILSQSNN